MDPGLAAHDITCAGLAVNVDTSDFRPGGWVRVDLSCTISLSDLSGLWTPGTRTMQARGLAVVDSFRRVDREFGISEGSGGPNSRSQSA